jgi:hypothetical protein
MGPFRIVARHPDAEHHDHEWAQVGSVFDTAEDAQEVIDAAQAFALPVPGGVAIAERVKITVEHRLAEVQALGYEIAVQELAAGKTTKDGTVLAHAWVTVDQSKEA